VDFAAHTTLYLDNNCVKKINNRTEPNLRLAYLTILVIGLIRSMYAQDFQASESAHAGFAPAIASDSAGNFTVVWTDYRNARGIYGGSGSDGDIYGQQFTSAGTPTGVNFRVTDDSLASNISYASQAFPRIAMNKVGHFVVTWVDNRPRGTPNDPTQPYDFNIYAQLFDSQGNRRTVNFPVNDDTSGAQLNPDASMWVDGTFVIVWTNVIGPDLRVQAQRFDASGMKIGSNHTLTITGEQPRVATLEHGRFVVVTTAQGQTYDSLFQPFGPMIAVTAGREKSITVTPRGELFVAFSQLRPLPQNVFDSDIFAEAFDSNGIRIGGAVKVNDDGTDFDQHSPSLSLEDTNIVIVWTDHRNGYQLGVSACRDIYAQRFDTHLLPRGSNFKLSHEENASIQDNAAVALTGNRIRTVWLDARSGLVYPTHPPLARKDIWGSVTDFENPVEGTVIPCLPPPDQVPKLVNLEVYPNPCNRATTISYEIGRDGHVEINLYDVLGRQVEQIERANRVAGQYLKNLSTQDFASGVYILVLKLSDSVGNVPQATTKVMVTK
jgi:hypothetical protein